MPCGRRWIRAHFGWIPRCSGVRAYSGFQRYGHVWRDVCDRADHRCGWCGSRLPSVAARTRIKIVPTAVVREATRASRTIAS
jgi:hypothetical protein